MPTWWTRVEDWLTRPAGQAASEADARVVRSAGVQGAVLASRPEEEVAAPLQGLGTGFADDDDKLALFLAHAAELAARTVGHKPYPAQLLAVVAMLRGRSVEHPAGEGHTLVVALAALGWALSGHRVHVVSPAGELSVREAERMGPLLRAAWRDVAVVTPELARGVRASRYAADVVYVPATVLASDVLADRCLAPQGRPVVAEAAVAMVDEADAVLVDRAWQPLWHRMERPGHTPGASVVAVAERMVEGQHFVALPWRQGLRFTAEGWWELEEWFPAVELLGPDPRLLADVRVALRLRWGIEPADGGRVVDVMSVTELMARYSTVVAVGSTLRPVANELRELYGLSVQEVPGHRPSVRVDHASRLVATREERDAAAAKWVAGRAPQPVLVAAQAEREAAGVAKALRVAGVDPVVLSEHPGARGDELLREAAQLGRVTVASGLSGRGINIRLGEGVAGVGGLAVVGVGRGSSSRLDQQLRERAGRRGEPGESVFFASLEDPLVAEVRPSLEGAPTWGTVTGPLAAIMEECQQRVADDWRRRRDDWLVRAEMLARQRAVVLERREALLAGSGVEALREVAPQAWEALERGWGAAGARERAQGVLVAALDEQWSRHVEQAGNVWAAIRAGHLPAADPAAEHHRFMADEFRWWWSRTLKVAVGAVAAVRGAA